MFTGLIEEVGVVAGIERDAVVRIKISAPQISAGVNIGDSVAIDGVCLTATAISGMVVTFDAVEETMERTNLGRLRTGDLVNLERAVSAERLFGGHFVLGHVDTVGQVVGFDKRPGKATITISAPEEMMRYVVPKGSIAVDGISLTVSDCSSGRFTVAVIPHTIENTNLVSKHTGDSVNLEVDVLGKYVEKFISARTGEMGVTKQYLADAGFLED